MFVVAGCGSTIEGTAIAEHDVAVDSGPFDEPPDPFATPEEYLDVDPGHPLVPPFGDELPAVGEAVGCDVLDPVVTPYVAGWTGVPGEIVAGGQCMWQGATGNIVSVTAYRQHNDPEVLEAMRVGGNAIADPRVEEMSGVALDLVGVSLMTPTAQITVFSIGDEGFGTDVSSELDVALAVGQLLAE
ncbi:hypothetical protein Rrhod_3057 [Rhodococcus rhodnii LMG 5362]|uniref:DUF3558 domain-containing protein n=1 Tax=Rhodococcus rhodnii LMG 5362 TaxID=1273125 RepID=R7WJW7_9NOCA|nr:hypothetical protein Rrhod_3057 [Rhodococcus rhodnii LMG 5362]